MDTDAILDLMKETAAELITPRFRALSEHQIMEKGPGDLVTVADREAEVAIAEVLRRAYPSSLILGEEATSVSNDLLAAFASAPHAFTIDPVDGTRNFVKGSADHAVMVGELRDGTPVRGWIWEPERCVAHVVEAGSGVYRNGVRLAARTRTADPAALVGISSAAELRRASVSPLPPLQEPSWSAGLDYVRVFSGGADYSVFRHDWPWDHVPGSLMVAELGGRTGRLDGTDYDPRERSGWILSAASPDVFGAARGPVAAVLGYSGP